MKVELCGVLAKLSHNITPEKDRIDIVIEDWAIELKTVNTNYRCEGVLNKHRPITKNIKGVLDDVCQLKRNPSYHKKAVSFIVFPLPEDQPQWLFQLNKIEAEVLELKAAEFHFNNGVRGMLYLGLVSEG